MAPERETPGITARHCATPMISVSRHVTCASSRCCVAVRSANSITKLNRINAPPTNHRLRKVVSIASWNSRPTMTIGIVPRISAQANL